MQAEPEYFLVLQQRHHYRLRQSADGVEPRPGYLRVTNPQIINGQQTTRTLARSRTRRSDASVLVRVISVPRPGQRARHDFETLVSRIVSATNWQNAIRPSDLMSNDRCQIEIERQLRKLHYLYLRKRMTKGEARRTAGTRHLRLIKKEEFAQAVGACDLDSFVVREGKERLFEERLYSQVFPTADPHYYLSRYWLMRQVSSAARGYPERAYAKWLALHFAWQSLKPLCRKRSHATAFREACERDTHAVVAPLRRALGSVFVAALRFYRLNRGSGPTAIDVSTFSSDGIWTRTSRATGVVHVTSAAVASRAAGGRFEKALDEEMI